MDANFYCTGSNPGKSSLEHIESSNSEPENDSLEFIDIFFDPYDDNIKFLKDMQKYTGIIGSQAPFISFNQKPTYDNMNESQKAWYFYWRTEVRNNRYPNTGVYYIFIHMYELLCGYGWTNAANGYDQIRALWLSYRKRFPSIDHYFFDWSFDFAQLHNIKFIVPEEIDSNIITDSTKCNILIEQYSADRPLKLPFSLIDILCNYSIISSKFYNDENQLLMRAAIPRVISLVDIALLKKYEKGLLALYCPNKPRKQFYHAFVCAACPKKYKKKVTVYAKRYLESQKLRDYISQVARYAENVLREIKGYRLLRNIQLDADMAALVNNFLKREYSNYNITQETYV